MTPFSEYPPKGRATGGVRCHRFLKGEDELVFAWAGAAPALAAADSGAAGRAPRAGHPARRVRPSRQPADRRVRRAGRDHPPGGTWLWLNPRHGRLTSWLTPRAVAPSSLIALALAASMFVAGCGGEERRRPTQPTPTEVMQTAKKKFDDASSVHIALSTTSTPSSGNGVLGATGDVTHDPAFKGDVKVVLSGLTATVPITSVDGKVYAKLPLQTKYSVIDPGEYGAPDPADFADPENGLSGLLTKIDGLKKGSKKRSGDTIVTTYTGNLPGAAVKKIIPSASAKQTYKTSVGIDDKGYAKTVKVTGTFFTGNDDVTYDVKFDSYDKGVKITAPTA